MDKLFYAHVDADYIVAAAEDTSLVLRRLIREDLRLNYTIRLSPTGQEPATRYGCNGLIENPEADDLIALYNAAHINNVRAWMLSADGAILEWTRLDGHLDPPQDGKTFEEFLIDQGLQIITSEPGETVGLMIVVPKNEKGQVQGKLIPLLGPGDYASQRLSQTGSMPASHWIGYSMIPITEMDAIKGLFPYDPQDTTHITLMIGERPIWKNTQGDVTGEPTMIAQVAKDENLKPIPSPP